MLALIELLVNSNAYIKKSTLIIFIIKKQKLFTKMYNLFTIASIAALSAAESVDYDMGIPGNLNYLNSLHDNASH